MALPAIYLVSLQCASSVMLYGSMLQSDTQIRTYYRTSLLSFVRYLNVWCDNLKSARNQVVSDVIIRNILDSPCGGFENC